MEGFYHHIVASANQSPYRPLTAAGFMNIYFGRDEGVRKLADQKKEAEARAAQAQSEAERARAGNNKPR